MDNEAKLITEMKDLAKTSKGDLNIKGLKSLRMLMEFEDSKEAALLKARDLLSEELRVLFLDNSILDDFNDKSHKDLVKFNNRLADIQGSKKDALQKMHLLDISKKEVEGKLRAANEKVKQLERRYEKFLKR